MVEMLAARQILACSVLSVQSLHFIETIRSTNKKILVVFKLIASKTLDMGYILHLLSPS